MMPLALVAVFAAVPTPPTDIALRDYPPPAGPPLVAWACPEHYTPVGNLVQPPKPATGPAGPPKPATEPTAATPDSAALEPPAPPGAWMTPPGESLGTESQATGTPNPAALSGVTETRDRGPPSCSGGDCRAPTKTRARFFWRR